MGLCNSGMGWDGVGGVCYSLVSKSLPTRWEEPFPTPADPHKTHLSSILPLLCTTFPSDMLSTERIQHTTSGTKHGPRQEHITGTWTLHLTEIYEHVRK